MPEQKLVLKQPTPKMLARRSGVKLWSLLNEQDQIDVANYLTIRVDIAGEVYSYSAQKGQLQEQMVPRTAKLVKNKTGRITGQKVVVGG